MHDSDLIAAIRSIRDEWQIEENIKLATNKLREKELALVKKEVADAEAEASSILAEAKNQADQIIKEAKIQAHNFLKEKEAEIQKMKTALEEEYLKKLDTNEKLKEELNQKLSSAKEDGRKQGYDVGHQEGMAQFANMVENLSQILASLEEQTKDIIALEIPDIRRFVKVYLEKVVGVLAENLIDIVLNNIEKGIFELSRAKKVKLIVSEQDYDTLLVMEAEFRKFFSPTTQVELVKDLTIKPGGCLLDSELGSVDATIEGQIALINQELRNE